ncbi:MAG TPA: hypothetical protein VEI97_09755, partial [bacterium]|nr:hypothetical protein [bacterium]
MALGSWALGRPAMLWADTILPWSSPVPASEAPANWPGWYELNAENPEYFVQGELQRQLMAWGWERNMLEPRNESTGVTTGQKNFPATSGFNMVLVATNALKQSTDAPPRVRAGVERTAELTTWPFTRETGVTDFTQLYMEQFVREGAPTTYAMFQIAEREIRQMFDPTPPGTGEDGIAAIRAQVEFCLNETSGWPDQTLGWYLVDEPELPGKVSPRNIQYLSFNRLLIVRSVIRDAEYDYRVANEPGFANLTIAERVARLRP